MYGRPYRLECSPTSARIVIRSSLDVTSLGSLAARCRALPPSIMSLHLDLRALGAMSADDRSSAKTLLEAFRSTKIGSFRLEVSHLQLTCTHRLPAVEAIATSRHGPGQSFRGWAAAGLGFERVRPSTGLAGRG